MKLLLATRNASKLVELRRIMEGAGLDGVEVFYVTHDREQTLFLADAAAERALLTTRSSDFHGPQHKLFREFLAFDLHGREPVLGPIAATAS